MKEFPPGIKFKYSWRSYQARVLDELQSHLDDNHLHIVAAPGSGKTVLGLEVVLRLNKPTLILAPTLTIRNQWISRFVGSFLRAEEQPSWISNDIRNPKFLTVSTYQGLYAAFSGQKDEESGAESEEEEERDAVEPGLVLTETNEVIKKIKKRGIKTIVLDEAHHLRKEWWKSLVFLKDNIKTPTTAALTATPPYGVSLLEWQRYQELCGPVDAEISVPELVLEQDLCPHQDYVFLNSLSREESRQIKIFRENVQDFLELLKINDPFIRALENHPCMQSPGNFIVDILDKPGYFSSIAIFLNHCGQKIPGKFLKIMGVSKKRIPPFDPEWAEICLTNFLYSDPFYRENYKDLLLEIKKELRSIGGIEKKKVLLKSNLQIDKLFKESINKLGSISEIVDLEYRDLRRNLRMVILTDFIRKELLPKKGEVANIITRMGVVPIFEKIRRDNSKSIKLGVLSGSLVIIPKTAQRVLEREAEAQQITPSHLKISALSHDKNFLRLHIAGGDNQKIVQLITGIFSQGEIEVLVGSKSLLGEGWDAPSINSLVLASFVGSFMLSNQMRGRAIRIDPANPGKTANIWHLVSVEKYHFYAGQDFYTLERRFQAFVGLSFKEDTIRDGFERMDMGRPPFNDRKVERLNRRTKEYAGSREKLRADWQRVLKNGKIRRIIPEIRTPRQSLSRKFVFFNTISALAWRSILLGYSVLYDGISGIIRRLHSDELEVILLLSVITAVIALVATLPGLVKALYLFFKHGPVASSIKQLGTALLKTLCKIGTVKTDPGKLKVVSRKNKYGILFCCLEGGTSYERTLFLDCLEEILNPIENPRYIIMRKSRLKSLSRRDYHAVPQIIGANKKQAQYFSLMWKKYVGSNRLTYTRNLKGRKTLLFARQNAMATSFQRRAERISTWK